MEYCIEICNPSNTKEFLTWNYYLHINHKPPVHVDIFKLWQSSSTILQLNCVDWRIEHSGCISMHRREQSYAE